MLHRLLELGIYQFGKDVLTRSYPLTLLTCIRELETELYKADASSPAAEQKTRQCAKHDDFAAAEFADYYQVLAWHFHNPTTESAAKVSRHSYRRRFYRPGHGMAGAGLTQIYLNTKK